MKALPAAILLILTLAPITLAQNAIEIPDTGWRLWLDRNASWEHDSIYLPGQAKLENLPQHPPSGGWSSLGSDSGIAVTLPTTVEEHFWGVTGFRKYNGEYYFENQDTGVRNGSYLGVSWWWRDIDVPPDFAGKKAILNVRGARLRAEVYWNSKLVGYNIITETSFTCDVTPAIVPGKTNLLAIRITNPGGRLDWLDTELMTWGSQRFHKSHGFGGLDRGLKLHAHNPMYFSDLWTLNTFRTRTITAHAAIENTNGHPTDATVRFEIFDSRSPGKPAVIKQQKAHLKGSGHAELKVDLKYDKALLWSEKTPNLYQLRATLITSRPTVQKNIRELLTDRREVTFGFRWFTADGIGKNAMLRLNGDRIRLVSAISWGFWGKNGLWPTPELAEREVRAAKALGLNCIQFHRNVGKAEVFDAQDRLGLLRYMEPGGGQTSLGEKFSLYSPSPKTKIDETGMGGDAETFAEKYMEEKIVRMVRDHRSHPSLLLYCIQNEIHPDLHNPRIFRILRRVHEEDPSRIVVLKSGFPEDRPVNEAWMEPYSNVVHHDTGDGYCGWWDAHTVGGPGVWRDEMYVSPDSFTHRSTNAREIVMWGEMLGAAVPDNHEAMVRQLDSIGGQSYDLAEHREILGACDRFLDRWHFRDAFPTAGALFRSIGNKSYDFWGRVIETAKLSDENDYFVISGWESTAIENHSGLVDNLRGFKGDPELIRRRLEPLRVVSRSKSIVVPAGSRAALDVSVIDELNRPAGKKLRVSLQEPTGKIVELGSFTIPPYQRDVFVYPIARNVATPPLASEGVYPVLSGIDGKLVSLPGEELLVVDTMGTGSLPRIAGVLSGQPFLQKELHPLAGLKLEPYDEQKQYDILIATDRFTNPPSASVEPDRKIKGTEDEELYRSANYGGPENFDYVFSALPRGVAKVTLRFAEIFQNQPGVRVFDVAINGDTVLKDFDVFKAAGGKDIAYDRTFSVPDPEGLVRITVPRVAAGSARFCAIKIEAGDSVIAVNCGGGPYRDKNGVLWGPYRPPIRLDSTLLGRVRDGLPLLVCAEGEIACQEFAERLAGAGAFRYDGHVGEARASWMGSWYFVRKHPVFDGLPADCGMGSYYQVPVQDADGVMVDGDSVDVFVGYGRDHDRNIGAGAFTARLGKGKIVFLTMPGMISAMTGGSAGVQPVIAKRLIANAMRWLTSQ